MNGPACSAGSGDLTCPSPIFPISDEFDGCQFGPLGSSAVGETMAVKAERITAWLDRCTAHQTVHSLPGRRGLAVRRLLRHHAAEHLEGERQQDVRASARDLGYIV